MTDYEISLDGLFSFCRYAHIGKDHLIKLLKQLLLSKVNVPPGIVARNVPNAADVPTLLGTGSFSLLGCNSSIHTSVLLLIFLRMI